MADTKGKILVVDDDRLVLATLAHGLAQAGYEVVDADNGDDAILLAREQRPQLALLDIRMEGKSGFDVAAYLREYLQVPFMFLSAFTDDETRAQVKELGAVDYLVKPLDIRQIVPAVDAAFAQIGAAASAPAQPPAHPPAQKPAPAAPQATGLEAVSVAVGVLMQRHALDRQAALLRLQQAASADGVAVAEHAERVLRAAELLAR
jgi:two-component system, response regulator PdtaR